MTEQRSPFERELQAIRAQQDVPTDFPDEVLRAALVASQELPAAEREDQRGLPLITIDPPDSRDLDQAFFAERSEGGYRVYYAISDIGSFVARGSVIEQEAFQRGVTLYSPDLRTPLYPPALCEGAASLLPDGDRPAILFTFALNHEAEATLQSVRRAIVRSRAKLGYPAVGAHLRAEREKPGSGAMNGHSWTEALSLLEEIGRKRQHLEVLRGGVSLQIQTQHVQRSSAALTGYHLTLEDPEDIEGWNAQISLMTGMAAAQLMREHKIGVLRVLDPPREDKVAALRLTAEALQVAWPPEHDYVAFIRSLDPKNPVHTAVMYHATGVMGGARYEAFEGEAPLYFQHAAIASFYAHVTAPLRRLADRYVLDLLVELSANRAPDARLREVLPRLPAVMQNADRRARSLESAIVDFAEARLLSDHIGQRFEASIIKLRADKVTVQLKDPPVRTDLPPSCFSMSASEGVMIDSGARIRVGGVELSLGDSLKLRLLSADPSLRKVTFSPIGLSVQKGHWQPLIAALQAKGVSFAEGLTEEEISSIEARFLFRFPPDLRSFLQAALPMGEGFPNWRGDEADLRERLRAPLRGLLFDVEHNSLWLEEFGPKPDNLPDMLHAAELAIQRAPKLIPIYLHRMMPEEPNQPGNPVLSVYQSDIIYYGFDLEDYLRHEFRLPGRKSWPAEIRPIRFWSTFL